MYQEIIIEIRDHEGGEDSKLLVEDLKDIYLRFAQKNKYRTRIQESRSGFTSI